MFRNILSIIAALTLALAALDAQTPAARRVAITIDDCPVVNEMTDLGNFQRITNGLVGSFQVEKVPVTTFINERQLNVPGQRDARAAVVEQWLNAGFELGNHTYSHQSASKVPVDQFQDDIVKGEVITRAILEQRGQPAGVAALPISPLWSDRRDTSGHRRVSGPAQISRRPGDR